MTVYRRYHELRKNLQRLHERALAELGYRPDVVLVWASPELSRLWLMDELLQSGQLTHVVGRPSLAEEGEGLPTAHPESVNMRQGLEYIRAHYDPQEHYVTFLAADIWLQDGTLDFIRHHMAEGNKAVLFHWENGCVYSDIWHTNCYGVCLDERYWPPISSSAHMDTLERQWGMNLVKQGLGDFHRWHNSGCRRFLHRHESEELPALPHVGLEVSQSVPLSVRGAKSWWARLCSWLRGVCLFKKP